MVNNQQLLARVRRIAGQIAAIEKALTSKDGCSIVLQRITAARGALNGLMAVVLEQHVDTHIVGARSVASRQKAADELVDIVRTYLK